MRYCVIVLVACGLAAAYAPNSFRWQSTAGLWEDDYDLLLEPARIPLISGTRAYTALSNLVSGQEEQFGSATDNFFVIGGSSDFAHVVFPGVVLDQFNRRTPLFTGLVGQGNDSLFGNGRLAYSQLLDPDSNGTYDYKVDSSRSVDARDESGVLDYYLGLGTRLGSVRLGAAFAHSDYAADRIRPSDNYLFRHQESSLVAGKLTYLDTDSAVGTDKRFLAENNVIVSGWYDAALVSVGLRGEFAPLTDKDEYTRTGLRLTQRSPADSSVIDYARIEVADQERLPYSGKRMGATASFFYRPRPEFESRLYADAYTQSMAVASDAGGLDVLLVDSTVRPGVATGSDSLTHAYGGERAVRGLGLRTSQLLTMSDRFSVGIGLGFATSAAEDSLVSRTASRNRYAFDNGDSLAGHEDSTVLTTSSEEWLNRTTSSALQFSVPVGLEFRVVPSVALRLGAEHRLTRLDVTRTGQLIGSEPAHRRVDYGDGTFYESLGDVQQYPGQQESTNSTTHATEFSYGIGYSPISNLQIDLMGFQRLTDLANWRLSVAFRF